MLNHKQFKCVLNYTDRENTFSREKSVLVVKILLMGASQLLFSKLLFFLLHLQYTAIAIHFPFDALLFKLVLRQCFLFSLLFLSVVIILANLKAVSEIYANISQLYICSVI